VRSCQQQGLGYTFIPGPSSVIGGLVLSAMPTDQFTFCGFADPKKFETLQAIPTTLIFFESAQRLEKTLMLMRDFFKGRTVSVVREITKTFEQVVSGTFDETIQYFQNTTPRGEIVLVLSPSSQQADKEQVRKALTQALKTMSIKDASYLVAKTYGLNKKQVYEMALKEKETLP
jgi:16S rRNA (cytidine1402-2'-O)-methyltransferase